MIQYLVIAGRNHPDLYSYLRRQFAGDDKVQVLLDRRHEERRRRGDAHRPDRRRGDRRVGRVKDNGLNYHGFVVVRQFSGLQWRPPWWGSGLTEAAGSDRQPGADEAKAVDARNLVAQWVTEGQRMLSVVPKLLQEHEHLAARTETAERKCQRFEDEIKNLRSENEHFRRERRQTVETLKALTKHLIESAGAVTSTNS
ncbi:MAG: hypothetical protein EHM71_05760 [Zetaproteobacteria bacterium]|nr:MAG: hypothetical protein EHM71_05760 [Zetaproteobacteria bacterium]